jgi:hypothetical protein
LQPPLRDVGAVGKDAGVGISQVGLSFSIYPFVIPAKAGTQQQRSELGSRFRGNDELSHPIPSPYDRPQIGG